MIHAITTTTTTEKNYHDSSEDSVSKRTETSYKLHDTDRVFMGYHSISFERGNAFDPEDGSEHTVTLHNYSEDLIAEAALALLRRAVSELDDTSEFSRNRARNFLDRVTAILPTSRVTLPGEV
jgi:hypothetical protein